jgi:hypothetical protein
MQATPEAISNISGYLQLIGAGGFGSVLTVLWIYHKYLATPKQEEFLKEIENLNILIKHEREERKKFNPRFQQLQQELQLEKANFVDFMNWYEIFKKETNSKITKVEEREHTHYIEVRDMKNEDRMIKQELDFVKEKVTNVETSVQGLANSIEDLKTLLIKTIARES